MMISASGAPRSQSKIRITSLPPLDPCGAVGRDRAASAGALTVIEAEVHPLARAHPATDDAAGEPEQDRDRRGGRARGRGLRRVRVDRLTGSRRRGGRRRETRVPPAEYRPAEARHRKQRDGRDEETNGGVQDRGLRATDT